jgi:transcriptional regulator with XRE-family HTH domain
MHTPHPLTIWRKSKCLSQREFAEMVGVDRVTVNRWESGARLIDVPWLPAVAAATGIPAARLRPDLAALFLETS